MKRLIALILFAASSCLGQSATVTWGTAYQTIQGFGAGDMFSGTAMNPYDNLVFNTLGYSLLRTEAPQSNGICDGSPSSGCANGQDNPGEVADMQSCVANGCKVWVYNSSPPGEYNTSGSYMCTDPPVLILSHYQNFANYLANFVASLNSYESVVPTALSVQNEPDLTCGMPAASIDNFVKNNLYPALQTAGQTSTQIMIPESSEYASLTTMANTCMGDSGCYPYVGIVAYHGYDNVSSPTDPYSTGAYWETEHSECCGTSGPCGTTWCGANIADGLFWAGIVDTALTAGVQAWHYFEYVNSSGSGTTGSNSGLIDPTESPAYSTRLYTIAQWAKFVRPGFVRIGATHNPQTGISITAFKNLSTNQYAIIAINQNSSNTNQTFSLSGFPGLYEVTPWVTSSSLNLAQQANVSISSGAFSYSLPAQSVTSFVSLGGSAGNAYYISAAGSDSNNGTSKSTPWAHAPGMGNCAGNCATVQTTISSGGCASLNFIFEGGGTWHFGNSGATPYTGGTWTWPTSGSSSAPCYVGVDQTWFTGSSWTRPILSADNPTNTSAVASCAYQVGSSNNIFNENLQTYVTFDNFEMTGLCQNDANAPFAHDNYLINGDPTSPFQHIYIHGWTHTAFSCSGGSGQCANLQAFQGVNNILQMFVDGSDSDPTGLERGGYDGCYNISQSVFRYMVGFVCTNMHGFHDNLMEYIEQPGDGYSHGNVLESSGEYGGTNVVYNNVIRHVCITGGCATVGLWITPIVGYTDYYFNNVTYDWVLGTGDYFLLGNNTGQPNSGNYTIFNNTFQNPTGGSAADVLLCNNLGPTYSLTAVNNHYISDTGPYGSACSMYQTASPLTELTQTNAVADANTSPAYNQYSASQTYAYSPVASTNSTVGQGTNRQSFCTTLLASSDPLLYAAGQACQSDTGYACSYNLTGHTISCPARTVNSRPSSSAWDQGAYEYSASSAPTLTFTPSSLSFGNQNTSSSSSPMSIQINNSGTATETISSIVMSSTGTSTGTNFSETNNCGSTLAVGAFCTAQITFTPTTTGSLSDSLAVNGTVSGTAPVSGTGINPLAIAQTYTDCLNQAYSPSAVCSAPATTAGQAVVISLNAFSNVTLTNVTDNSPSGTSGYVIISGATSNNGTSTKSYIVWTPQVNAGATQWTITWSGNTDAQGGVALVNNINAVDQSCAANTQSASTTPTGCSVTTTHSAEYIASISNLQGNGSAISSPFTANSLTSGNLLGYDIVASTGSYAMAGTATSGTFNNSTASFYQTSSATGSRSPTSYNFGTQTSGTTSAAQTFTFTNNGPGTVTFSMLPSIGTSQYTVTSSTCVSLSPIPSLGTCTAMVTFNPTSTGSKTDTLTFASSATNTPQTVSLSGTGGSTGTPSVCFSPTTLAFGYVQTSGNLSLTDTLTNCGTANLTVSSVTVPSSEFTVSSNNCVSGSPIATTATCSIVVEFSPTALGTVSQNVSVAGNQAGSPALLPVTGTGVTVNLGLAAAAPQTTPQ